MSVTQTPPFIRTSLALKRNEKEIDALPSPKSPARKAILSVPKAAPRPRSEAIAPPSPTGSMVVPTNSKTSVAQQARVALASAASTASVSIPKVWTTTGTASVTVATPGSASKPSERVSGSLVRISQKTAVLTVPSSPKGGARPTSLTKTNSSTNTQPKHVAPAVTSTPKSPRQPVQPVVVEIDVHSGEQIKATKPKGESPHLFQTERASLGSIATRTSVVEITQKRTSIRPTTVAKVVKPERRTIPGANCFLEETLNRMPKSPFDRPVFGSMKARDLSFCLEDAYCPLPEILRALTLKFNQNDVVLCSALRTGQTPILNALYMLLSAKENIPSAGELLNHVGFLGTSLPHTPKEYIATTENRVRRLFKTHMSLRCFVRTEAPSRQSPKIVIVLRDPPCVVESWFRHVSAVHKAFEGTPLPFGQANFKLFCPGTFSASRYQEGEDYAKFVATAISVMHLSNVKIVFYEDILYHPTIVFRELAEFVEIKAPDAFVDVVSKSIADEGRRQEFKLSPVFSDEFLEAREQKWYDHVLFSKNTLRPKSYYDLYETLTSRSYPCPRYQSSKADTGMV